MTTDRIQPARPAAPTDRPSQSGDGAGFAALLEVHAGSAHAPRRDEAARPAARDGAPGAAAQHDGPRDAAARSDAARDDAPSAAAQHDGADGEARSDVSSAAAEGAAAAPAVEGHVATVPPVSVAAPIVDPLHPSLAGLPPAQVAPGGVAQDLAATDGATLVVPIGVAGVPAQRPAGAQPAGPAPVAAQSFEATVATPGQPAAVAPQSSAPAAAVPAPAAQAAVPVATPAPLGTPVEGEALVAAPVIAAPSPEPAAAAAPHAPAPAVEPARPEPQPAPTTSVGQPAPQASAATTSAPERAVPLHRAPAAVATLLHVAAERGVTHARMALRPAELGGIEIRLQATAAGVAAQVVADSPEAARLLAQAGDDLRRALEAREVTLLSLEVSTSSEQRSREGARGERTGEAGTAPTGDNAAAEAAESDVPTTHSVIELPGGLLVDVLA